MSVKSNDFESYFTSIQSTNKVGDLENESCKLISVAEYKSAKSGKTSLKITFDKDGKCKTYDIGSNSRNVIIKIFPPSASGTSTKGIFYGITLEVFVDPLRRYELPVDTKKVVINSNPSYTEESIDMLMHTAIGNERRLTGGYVQRCPFSYMFRSQLRHKRQVKMISSTDMRLAYLKRVTSSTISGRWRIVSYDFNPWDDEWTITMHRSSTL